MKSEMEPPSQTIHALLHNRSGRTISTQDHIENFIATGSPMYHICLLQLQVTFQSKRHFGVRPLLGFPKKKKPETHVALRANLSGHVGAADLVEVSKDTASLLVRTRKKIFCLGGADFFVSDVISGGLLGHLGPLCLALGANQ